MKPLAYFIDLYRRNVLLTIKFYNGILNEKEVHAMTENKSPQPLTEQEQAEVTKLFADFAANDPIATDTPQAEESADEAAELIQAKPFFTKKCRKSYRLQNY